MTHVSTKHQPVDAALVPRFAGIATFMRLPLAPSAEGLDIALYGIPGTAAPPTAPARATGHERCETNQA